MANFEVKISASINLLFLKSDLGIRVFFQTPIITWDYEMNFNGEIKIFYYLFDTYYLCMF